MNPKIDVTITDSHGDYAMLVSDNYEPYEVYVNNERFCTSERLDGLGSENDKLRERIEWLEEELRKQMSATSTFMAMARTYQEDNKKLRELYAYFLRQKKLAGCFDCFGGNCEEWGKCHGDCTFERRARELGIEASE